MRTHISRSIEETREIVKNFLSSFSSTGKAVIVGLEGDLGSGKTAFVKEAARLLNIKEHITSPTFVIQKTYLLKPSQEQEKGFSKLIHIDAYRLAKGEDLLPLSWNETREGNHLVFVEWPERVASVLPKETKKIYFEFIDDTTRKLRF